jgi:hypothetical protein
MRLSDVISFANFLALGCFFGLLPAAGAAVVLAARSITTADAAQILGEDFF